MYILETTAVAKRTQNMDGFRSTRAQFWGHGGGQFPQKSLAENMGVVAIARRNTYSIAKGTHIQEGCILYIFISYILIILLSICSVLLVLVSHNAKTIYKEFKNIQVVVYNRLLRLP